jgi:hypothetical protein
VCDGENGERVRLAWCVYPMFRGFRFQLLRIDLDSLLHLLPRVTGNSDYRGTTLVLFEAVTRSRE